MSAMILRSVAGIGLAALLVLLGCDAFGLSQIDDRRAAEHHELLHPVEASRGVVFGPRASVTGPGSVGMVAE